MDKFKVLIVDDEDINIDLLKNALSEDYNLYIAKDGFNCIDIMKKVKPDLVLLDIIMPERDGFKTLEIIKKNEDIAEIPVIIITALKEVSNVTKGFEAGAEDYITKPFNIFEIKARVKTHLEIGNSRREIKELLVKTLGGSVNMLMEILALSNPVAFSISAKIKELVRKIATELEIKDLWKLEMGGMLSMIGCYALPVLAFEKILLGQKVSPEEHKLFETYPEHGAKLLAKIPRMEDVSKIIEAQNTFYGNSDFDKNDIQTVGVIILNHALNFELLLAQGIPADVAFHIMTESKNKYNFKILKIMQGILSEERDNRYRVTSIELLEPGMILYKDIMKKDGAIAAKKDIMVSEILRQHLLILNKLNEIENRVFVKI